MIYQGAPLQFVFLAQKLGVPVTGMEGADIEFSLWKPGTTTFSNTTPADQDLVELGDGYYAITAPSGATSNLGQAAVLLRGVLFDTIFEKFDIISVPISVAAPPDVCIVMGNITDIGGQPGKGQAVRAYAPNFPGAAAQSIVTSDPIETVPDAQGNFSLSLLRGKTVIIEIARTGIRNQIIVPDQPTANVIDLLPPLV